MQSSMTSSVPSSRGQTIGMVKAVLILLVARTVEGAGKDEIPHGGTVEGRESAIAKQWCHS